MQLNNFGGETPQYLLVHQLIGRIWKVSFWFHFKQLHKDACRSSFLSFTALAFAPSICFPPVAIMRLTFLFFEWNVCWMDCRDIYSCSSQDDLRYCNNFWFQSKFESVQHFMIYDHNTCETNDIQPQLYFGKRHLLNISMSPLPLCELLPVQLHRAASTAQCYLDTFYLRYLTGKFMCWKKSMEDFWVLPVIS